MDISENYAAIFDYTTPLNYNEFILQFQPEFNVGFSERVYNLSIYTAYNKFILMNTANNYVIMFLCYSYFNSWWFTFEFYPKFNVILSQIEDGVYIQCV